MSLSDEEQQAVLDTFFPYAMAKREQVIKENLRFVHYTTGEAALNILDRNAVWLRSTSCMNDVSEVRHGLACVRAAWSGAEGDALRAALEAAHAGCVAEATEAIEKDSVFVTAGTYVGSFSEHPPSEDKHGRLSMWRAYCGGNGVALVLNPGPFVRPSDALKAYTSPVAYLSDSEFQQQMKEVAAKAAASVELLKRTERHHVVWAVCELIRYAVLCTKHPAFREEREWRVIYSPGQKFSPRLKERIVSVRGVPQTIHALPLEDVPEEGLTGLKVKDFVEKIIIGPTQYPDAMHGAFWTLLRRHGVENPEERIVHSEVPLRVG